MNISDINPFVRYCDIVPAPFISREFVKTYDGRLFFVVDGEGIFFVGHKTFPFQKNSLLLLPAGTRYRFEFDSGQKIELLAINFDFNQERSDVEKPYKIAFENDFDENLIETCPNGGIEGKVIFFKNFVILRDELMEAHEEYTKKSLFYREKTSSLLKNILIEIYRACENDGNSDLVEGIKEYIHIHYSEELPLDKIGMIFKYHPYHINRMFKQYQGETIHRYLTNHRLQRSKKLLTTTSLSIEDIANRSGFGSSAYYTSCFKKQTGITPTVYRKNKPEMLI